MSLPWRAHPSATDELLDAIRYYHQRQAGLGDEFAAQVDRATRDIQWNPDSWPPFPGWSGLPMVRSRRVEVFPYRVVYFVHDGEIVIVAYAPTARRPGYWTDRVDD